MDPNTLTIQSEFLEAEIEAGMSFVARARSEQASGNKQVTATALGNARKACQTASRELDRIREHLSAGEIARFQEKLDDLARAIAAVFPLGRGSPLLPAA